MSTQVVAVHENSYRDLVDATGKLRQSTRQTSSLTLTADLSFPLFNSLMERVLIEARNDKDFQNDLAKYVKSRDVKELTKLISELIDKYIADN